MCERESMREPRIGQDVVNNFMYYKDVGVIVVICAKR